MIMEEENKKYGWTEDISHYHGKPLEPFNLRWKNTDGTIVPIGNGLNKEGSVLIYFIELEEEGK